MLDVPFTPLKGSLEMATKTYEGRIVLKSGGKSIVVRAEATNPSEARKIIEAQFAGQIKSWSSIPSPVKK